ncbi:hypothetical protein MBLNU459_g2643t2 [Dothideomycetes sp. NU459]
MPRENKKRGRRGDEKKRKLEDGDGDLEHQKRQRLDEFVEGQDFLPISTDHDNGFQAAIHEANPMAEPVFFGMLDEEEQEYFKRADEMLELNNFGDSEERNLFLANVYREADGKELKIANSQSCSRLMERLIQLSNPAQLKTLFQKFSGHFIHLIQHRFASHCCEKLFTKAAPVVSEESIHPPKPDAGDGTDGQLFVSMENLFLFAIGELEGNIGFLMTDRFASHTLRVLLLVLAGEPLSTSSTKSLLQSKRKENVGIQNGDAPVISAKEEEKLAVPASFTEALQKLMSGSIAGLDTNSLRALATHQLGNPTLQLLIKLELTHFGKQKAKDATSIIRTLLPDDPITPESDSASFINALVYDPIGSHLVETIVEFAPGKTFKSLYRGLLKDRMASLARNETAGYVVCKVLERLSKDDLHEVHELIVPQIPSLLERNRFNVVKTLIQRCAVREIDTQSVAMGISEAYKTADGGFDIQKMFKIDEDKAKDTTSADAAAADSSHPSRRSNIDSVNSGAKLQGALLAQQMILNPGPLSGLIFDGLAALPPSVLQRMASDPMASRTLQAAMTSFNASIISRRKLVQMFYGNIGEMALDRSASRVVDAIWEGTHGLAFIRERIAEELAENEPALRENPCGRAVWKNWKMDIYKRKRQEWIRQSKIKASNDGFQSLSELDVNKDKNQNAGKSAIQLARERHAAKKAGRGGHGGPSHATGANATAAST